ncbi:hypothetical protein BDR07DRAFT_1426526 [Suillus spraguei]|nr:hypothetical protein BDR07DRAFT_1426526 [Suillus spraguei]
MASRLKLSPDGSKVLWPQPADDSNDPQNNMHLIIITMSAVVPDFDSGIVLFWSQVYISMIWLLRTLTFECSFLRLHLDGATLAPNLATFAGMCTMIWYLLDNRQHLPTSKGLYVVTDIFPFHLQARKLNIWTSTIYQSSYSWRWAYAIGSIYSAIVIFLIAFFMEETMYDRRLVSRPPRTSTGLRYRFETLIGITVLLASWMSLGAFVFGFSIGVNTTNVVFMGSPPPVGFGFSQYAIAVLFGELIGRHVNDLIMNLNIRKNGGFFEAESRLWTCYLAMPLYICGFLTLGAGYKISAKPLSSWLGIALVAMTLNTVAVYAYCNDCFPRRLALLNFARSVGVSFAVAYFQVPWATKSGALMVFGVEAAQVTLFDTLGEPDGFIGL